MGEVEGSKRDRGERGGVECEAGEADQSVSVFMFVTAPVGNRV